MTTCGLRLGVDLFVPTRRLVHDEILMRVVRWSRERASIPILSGLVNTSRMVSGGVDWTSGNRRLVRQLLFGPLCRSFPRRTRGFLFGAKVNPYQISCNVLSHRE